MRIWTVHLPPAARDDAPALVPEGFAWGALLFGPLWLVAHGAWFAAVGWVAIAVVGGALLPPVLVAAMVLGIQLLLGFSGRDLVRAELARRGWRLAHVVAATDREAALLRLLDAQPELARA